MTISTGGGGGQRGQLPPLSSFCMPTDIQKEKKENDKNEKGKEKKEERRKKYAKCYVL